jgi:hypothetical protein
MTSIKLKDLTSLQTSVIIVDNPYDKLLTRQKHVTYSRAPFPLKIQSRFRFADVHDIVHFQLEDKLPCRLDLVKIGTQPHAF